MIPNCPYCGSSNTSRFQWVDNPFFLYCACWDCEEGRSFTTPRIFYRYFFTPSRDYIYGYSGEMVLDKFTVSRKTPMGIWLRRQSPFFGLPDRWMKYPTPRPWAHDTPRAALVAYLHRRGNYIDICENRLTAAKAGLWAGRALLDSAVLYAETQADARARLGAGRVLLEAFDGE